MSNCRVLAVERQRLESEIPGQNSHALWKSKMPQLGRHFAPEKSDQSAVVAWENHLSQWGQKSLDAMAPDARSIEISRREAGASAAKDAVAKSVAAGGELTITPIVDPSSRLPASMNMLVLGMPPSVFLDRKQMGHVPIEP